MLTRFDDESRAVAHQIVDLLFDHVQKISERPVVDWKTPEELARYVALDQATGEPIELARLVTANAIQLHHPSYMGHQVCPPFAIATMAELLISTLNQSTAVWEMSPIATMIEHEVVRWLSDRAGYPQTSAGTLVSGGSAANLTALLAARARWVPEAKGKGPVLICSADAHYSVARAASIMGIPASGVIKVATDAAHRLDPAALEETLAALENDPERSVMAIVATAGSTATGAFDRLDELTVLRDRYRTWLHVDAAHGASVLLSEQLAPLIRGLSQADSFSWDPHKMLWMPLSLGVVLVRDGNWLRNAFQADAPYLFHAERANLNIGEMTIQCSKRADAVKFWLALRTLGTRPFADALESVARTTRYLYDQLVAADDFEPVYEPGFNILCFRFRSAGDDAGEANGRLREALIRSGESWITSTMLRGERVLRVTLINPATGEAEIDRMLASVRRLASEAGIAAARPKAKQ